MNYELRMVGGEKFFAQLRIIPLFRYSITQLFKIMNYEFSVK